MNAKTFYSVSSHFSSFKHEEITAISPIGKKAQGLYVLPKELVPPFVVLNYNLHTLWTQNPDAATSILSLLINDIFNEFISLGVENFIIRSSAEEETFDDRGHYDSSSGNIDKKNLHKVIVEIWKQNSSNLNSPLSSNFALIIQQYIKPKLYGHLSNERRVSRNKTDWLVEIVNERGDFETSRRITNKKLLVNNEVKIKPCKTTKDIYAFFNHIIKSHFLIERHHIEWVWDGQKVWLVQNDIEVENKLGSRPGSLWVSGKNLTDEKPVFTVLKTIDSTSQCWKKIECVKSFRDSGLPYGDVFILECVVNLEALNNDIFNQELIKDLTWILQFPIVIRMDIKGSDEYTNILLPRTETLFTLEQTKEFLVNKTRDFSGQGVKYEDFCFLIHRFIVSESCGLAFALPQKPKARIDSTWGIVDGLYYHPHDSFEVSLTDNSIKKLIRCKTQYLDIDKEGKWFSKDSGIDWDWAESLDKNQLIEITKHTTTLATKIGKPIVVMYFINVNRNTGYPSILPWFYTTEEVTAESEKSKDVIFSQDKKILRNKEDFQILKNDFSIPQSAKKLSIKIKLNPGLLRDKQLIEEIGTWAKEFNHVIELEGSILSHTYYILRKIGTSVKCINLFEPKYKKQKFYKLVRDNIPVNIESNGETVSIAKIESVELLEMLKEKAIEEALEFYWEHEEDKVVEEMADIYEILRSACKIFGISLEELGKIADKKSEKKGGFNDGMFLLETMESPLIKIKESFEETLFIENKNDKIPNSISSLKRKNKSINKVDDGLLNIPYALSKPQSNSENIKSVFLFGNNLFEFIHSKRGIQIRIIKDRHSYNPNQLDIFDSK